MRFRPALACAAVAGFGVLLWLERRRPLRRERESKLRRNVRNLAVASLGAAASGLLEAPLAYATASWVERSGAGLLPAMGWPSWARTAAAFVLLDYTLYWWHYAAHRVPLLWRFHLPHHADYDMDASTALRFHFGELAISVPYRVLQVAVIGVEPGALAIWQAALFAMVLFHHSNIDLGEDADRRIGYWLVTPRMHGIHHSVEPFETDSNYSSGLGFWDRLHGTWRGASAAPEVDIGLPAERDPRRLTLTRVLAMPFE